MIDYDWKQIHGFGDHDFQGFYELMVAEAPPESTLVEIGCFFGRSLVHLSQTAANADKGLHVVGIDWGRGMGGDCINPDTIDSCYKHLKSAGLIDMTTLIVAKSLEAARFFAYSSCWMVFLDAAHLHDVVAAEIDAWMPIVTPGGYLAGHDYFMHTVAEPVNAKIEDVQWRPEWKNVWFAKKQPVKVGVDIHAATSVPKWGWQT